MKNKTAAGIYSFLSINAIWYILSLSVGSRLIPYPHDVWINLFRLFANGTIFMHMLYSLMRMLAAMVFAVVIGLPLGLVSGINKTVDKYVSPITFLLFPIPKIAFLPVFIALFGLNDLSKIILLFTVLIFQVIIAARDGVKQIPVEYSYVVRLNDMPLKKRIAKLYLPSALPNLLSSLKIGVGISMAVLFFGENYATTYGMGYFIMNNWIMVNYVGMFSGITALALLAGLLIFLIEFLERRLCPWLFYDKRQSEG